MADIASAAAGAITLAGVLAAGYAGLQWMAPKLWEEWSARAKVNRTFAEKTTDNVVQLASRHYWALANLTGTLSQQLDAYLRAVEAHLFVVYRGSEVPAEDAPDPLRVRMRELAGEAAQNSFPALVRTIAQFELFQFRGSQTYLLPHFAAGRALRQLYNLFASRLPEGEFLTHIRLGVEIHVRDEAKTAGGDPGPGLAGSFLEDDRRVRSLGLALPRAEYERWLRDDIAAVSDAAAALRAFAQVLGHELAELNRVFFRDRSRYQRASEFGVHALASTDWPNTIEETSLPTLRRAEALSEFYLPLGGMLVPSAAFEPSVATGGVERVADRERGTADDVQRGRDSRGGGIPFSEKPAAEQGAESWKDANRRR